MMILTIIDMWIIYWRINDSDKLKNENHKLEQKLLKLYEEQAEQTKRTAERNGVGG